MKIIRFEPLHFSHLHQSLCAFTDMNTYDAKALCYVLYAANQDTYYEITGFRRYQQVNLGEFLNIIDHAPCRSYRTVVQFYRSLEALLDTVNCCFLIELDRIYLMRIDEIMANLEKQFIQDYSVEICGPETVYSLCSHHLVPFENEPTSCLMKEHIRNRKSRQVYTPCGQCRSNTRFCQDDSSLARLHATNTESCEEDKLTNPENVSEFASEPENDAKRLQ